MESNLRARFEGLSREGKARVLARLIHMETIHVRSAHLDDPTDANSLYGSSEFMHRLSGYILAALGPGDIDAPNMIDSILTSVRPRGQYYVDKLEEWTNAEA